MLPSLQHHSPLRDRVSRSTTRSPTNESTARTTYRNWTEISMREALDAVNLHGMSASKASIVYGIPRSTLNDHIHGDVLPGAKAGAPTLLSTREEEELVEFLCQCADIGYAKTRHEVFDIVSRMLTQKEVDREKTVTRGGGPGSLLGIMRSFRYEHHLPYPLLEQVLHQQLQWTITLIFWSIR